MTFQRPGGGPGGGGDGAGGRVRQQAPRVWLMDEAGKLRMAFIRTGVADTTYSEIVRGELKEGDVVIAGTLTASSTSPSGPGMGQMMFMGGPAGGRR
jgi:HlyD family secretion protein